MPSLSTDARAVECARVVVGSSRVVVVVVVVVGTIVTCGPSPPDSDDNELLPVAAAAAPPTNTRATAELVTRRRRRGVMGNSLIGGTRPRREPGSQVINRCEHGPRYKSGPASSLAVGEPMG